MQSFGSQHILSLCCSSVQWVVRFGLETLETQLFLELWWSDHNTTVVIFVMLVWIYFIGIENEKVDVMVAVMYVKPTIINGFAAREAMLGTHYIYL